MIMPEVIVAEGRAARRAGTHHSANPYRGWEYYHWHKGWKQERANPTPPAPEPEPEVSAMPSARQIALVLQFEQAVEEHAFIGCIPVVSEDHDEQLAINKERRRLTANLTKTRNNLLLELARVEVEHA